MSANNDETPIYTVEYEDPSPSKTTQSGGKLYQSLQQVAADNNGRWAVITRCPTRSGANSILTAIKQGKRRVPEGLQFEYTCRADVKTNTSKLYALFLGPVEPDEDVVGPITRNRHRGPME